MDVLSVMKIFIEKEKVSEEVMAQLRLIREKLGSNFTYDGFENFIPGTITSIDDILDISYGILDIYYLDGNLDYKTLYISEKLLKMTESELKNLNL